MSLKALHNIVIRADLLLPTLPTAKEMMKTALQTNYASPDSLPPQASYTQSQVTRVFGDSLKADAIWGTYWTAYRRVVREGIVHRDASKFFRRYRGISLVCYHPEGEIRSVLKEKMWRIPSSAFTNYITDLKDLSPQDGKTVLITNYLFDCERIAGMKHVTVDLREDLSCPK